MATTAQIQAALATAQSSALSWGDKADLLRLAIDNALVGGAGEVELPWANVGADGTNIARMSIKEAAELAVKFDSMDSGGIVGQYVELRDPGRGHR